MTTEEEEYGGGPCKICGVPCSDKIPWKQHHDHKLDDRLQNDQDKGGYHLCNTHRCTVMYKVTARNSKLTVKSRCRDMVEVQAAEASAGKRKRDSDLCKVHADAKEKTAERKKKKPNTTPEEDPLHPWLLNGDPSSIPIIAGRQIAIDGFTFIMPDSELIEGLDKRGNWLNRMVRGSKLASFSGPSITYTPDEDTKDPDDATFEQVFTRHWQEVVLPWHLDVEQDALGRSDTSSAIRSIEVLDQCLKLDMQTMVMQATCIDPRGKIQLAIHALAAQKEQSGALDHVYQLQDEIQRFEGQIYTSTAGNQGRFRVDPGTSVDIEMITGIELVFVESGASGHQHVVLRRGDRLNFTNTTNAIFYTIEPTIKRVTRSIRSDITVPTDPCNIRDVYAALNLFADPSLSKTHLDRLGERASQQRASQEGENNNPYLAAIKALLPVATAAYDLIAARTLNDI